MYICEHCGDETDIAYDHDGELWCQDCYAGYTDYMLTMLQDMPSEATESP